MAGRHRLARSVRLVHRVCQIAGNPQLISDTRRLLTQQGVVTAVHHHDSSVLFNWLVEGTSYQGISDSVAHGYMARHGKIRWQDIATGFAAGPSCPRLTSYSQFEGCGYRKGARSCAEPSHFLHCPLPTHNLRNGRLNQTAYSLFLFVRDVASGDLVAWFDERLAAVDLARPGHAARLRAALLEPMNQIQGVSSKVLSMVLSSLLLATDPTRERWVKAGSVLIAVDTLVHNLLYRTGITQRLGAAHPYGHRCYRPDGCAAVIEQISAEIDARRFNAEFPANFPRYVQHALWRFCAENGLNECNGHQIDDRNRCDRSDCPAFRHCDRIPLKPERSKKDD